MQAKGYSGNVGNHAVMEASAGMIHYRCDCCLVVTNSDFTKPARVLAHSVGCRLVAGHQMPDLIAGNCGL